VAKVATILMACVLLNMSFFLAEISMLRLDHDSGFRKVFALILFSSCMEEERDASQEAHEEQPSAKKIELVFHHYNFAPTGCVLLAEYDHVTIDCRLDGDGIFETSTPPPKI
jgi:hypothetical protein